MKDKQIDLVIQVASKTIGAGIEGIPFDHICEKINSVIKNATDGQISTNGVDGLKQEIKAKYENI